MAPLLPTPTSPAASSGSPHRGLSVGRPDDPEKRLWSESQSAVGHSPPCALGTWPCRWACVSSTGNGPGWEQRAWGRRSAGPQWTPYSADRAGSSAAATPEPHARGLGSTPAEPRLPAPAARGHCLPFPRPGSAARPPPARLQSHGWGASRARGPERTPGPRWDRPAEAGRCAAAEAGPGGVNARPSPPPDITGRARRPGSEREPDGRRRAAALGARPAPPRCGSPARLSGGGVARAPAARPRAEPPARAARAAGRRPPGPRAPRAAHRCGARTHHPRRARATAACELAPSGRL